jgi:hypothetical protein
VPARARFERLPSATGAVEKDSKSSTKNDRSSTESGKLSTESDKSSTKNNKLSIKSDRSSIVTFSSSLSIIIADLVILISSNILFYSFAASIFNAAAACNRITASFFTFSFFLSASRAFLRVSSLFSRSFATNTALSAIINSRFAGSYLSVVNR